ncbi:type II secretion system protein [Citreimonas sp.]|uniref:type II secretion system protein n=1 Tax=Citreimonas sp. TaxID=3036715 RepID=UPI0035C82DC1
MTAQAGFTLVETLVVAAILSVLAVGATLVVNRAGAGSDAARFARVFADTRHRAVVGQQALALVPGPGGLGLLRQGAEGWSADSAEQPWRGRVVLAGGTSLGAGTQAVVLLPTGQTSAFSLRFTGSGDAIECRTDGWADLACGAG